MEKISTVLQIIFWAALGVVLEAFVVWYAIKISITPLYEAVVYWLEYGVWQVETFGSIGVVNTSSWVGLNKILSFFANIPTWWPYLIGYGILGLIVYSFTFLQALELYQSLKENDEDLDDYDTY